MNDVIPSANPLIGDEERASVERLLRLSCNQGIERQYHNEVVGLNNGMTDIHAAIGRVQLTKVDAWARQRQANAAFLTAHPRGVTTPPATERIVVAVNALATAGA